MHPGPTPNLDLKVFTLLFTVEVLARVWGPGVVPFRSIDWF